MIYVVSGNTKLFAAIGVTYPAGSTLTCTNGTKTLTAKNTSGQWVFAIPEAGTWTVKATDGSNTKSQSVSITTEGQSVKVTLAYEVVYFDNGSGEYKDGWGEYITADSTVGVSVKSTSSTSSLRVVGSSSGTINLTNISTLNINVSDVTLNGGSIIFFVNSSPLTDYTYNSAHVTVSAYVAISSTGTKSIDVSKLSGNYYMGFSVLTGKSGSASTSASVSKIIGA